MWIYVTHLLFDSISPIATGLGLMLIGVVVLWKFDSKDEE